VKLFFFENRASNGPYFFFAIPSPDLKYLLTFVKFTNRFCRSISKLYVAVNRDALSDLIRGDKSPLGEVRPGGEEVDLLRVELTAQ
jgi:hypothetical protein